MKKQLSQEENYIIQWSEMCTKKDVVLYIILNLKYLHKLRIWEVGTKEYSWIWKYYLSKNMRHKIRCSQPVAKG